MNTNYKLESNDKLSQLAISNGIESWDQLIDYVKNLPYGRNTNRIELELVLLQKRGTCSSKHALLKSIADSNNIPNIELIMGIYEMTENNTPKIGAELTKNFLTFIPEAHCYLKINGKRTDLTTLSSSIEKIEKDIIEEVEIEPKEIVEFKVGYHKKVIKDWLKETSSEFQFEQIWKIRENCIKNLSQ